MQKVNRSIAIIRPKQHFMKWANANTPNDRALSFDYFTENYSFTVLMPYYDLLARNQAKRYVAFLCEQIFEHQLSRWNTDENTWPTERSKDVFNKWFTVEFVYDVIE